MGINRIVHSFSPIPLLSGERTVLLSSPPEHRAPVSEKLRRSFVDAFFALLGEGGIREDVPLSDAQVRRWCAEGGPLPSVTEPPPYDASVPRTFAVHVDVVRPEAALHAVHTLLEQGSELLGRIECSCDEVGKRVHTVVHGQTFQNVTRGMARKMAMAWAEVAIDAAERSLALRERLLRESIERQRKQEGPPEDD